MKINKSFILFMFLMISASGIFADSLSLKINQIISKDFPKMEVYLSCIDKTGEPVLSLSPENFKAFVDGNEIKTKMEVAGFQYTRDGINYALIISANGLMEGEPLDQQKKAAMRLIENMKDNDRLSVFAYGEDVKAVFENEKKSATLQEKISKIEISGFNPVLYDSVVFASRKFDNIPGKRKVILIMSDGREIGSKYTQDQTNKILQDSSIPVFSVGFRVTTGQNLYRLADISDKSGGYYVFAGDVGTLSKKIEVANRQISLGYVLKFKVGKIEGDNAYHQLQIKVRYMEEESNFNKNFIATKVPIKLWVKIVILIACLVVLAGLILLIILLRRKNRKNMGISKRKCPVCKRRMKDDWDECVFCKYLPPKKKNKKEAEKYK
jgi:hypothetical protein